MFHRYLEIKPSQFHVGDIVEVQASFVVVPLKDQKFKMLTTMRALTLLNSAFSLVSNYSEHSYIGMC